jgi:hypothetical protein
MNYVGAAALWCGGPFFAEIIFVEIIFLKLFL